MPASTGLRTRNVAPVTRAVLQGFLSRAAAEADRRYSAGTHYKDSTRHYFEVAHQDYLRALQHAIHELEASA